MLKEAEQEEQGYTLYNFLQDKFSRVSANTAGDFCKAGRTDEPHEGGGCRPRNGGEALQGDAGGEAPAAADGLPGADRRAAAARGHVQGRAGGVLRRVEPREPAVYRGRPFLIEAAIAFGGELPTEDPARVIRFANRVPLLFQQSACSASRR